MWRELETWFLFAAGILGENARRDPLVLPRSMRLEDPSSLASFESRYVFHGDISIGWIYAGWRFTGSTAHFHRSRGGGQFLGGWPASASCPVRGEPDPGQS